MDEKFLMKRCGTYLTFLISEDRYSRLIFWTAAFFLLFYALGCRGLWGSEDRWAEITREMFLSGDFFHPTINGDPYFDKPLLTYWLIALFSWMTGGLSEWTVRVPSAASGLLVLWATVSLGSRLWSEKTGRIAGWILLTTYGILFWSRTACADMENLAAIIIAVAWYWARRERPGFSTFLIFYLICFLGSQTKGLAALAVPVVAVLPDVMREKQWKRIFSFPHLLALCTGAAVYAAPFIYSGMTRGHYGQSGISLVFRENILRYFHPFDHREPFYAYFRYLPELFLPWTPLLLIALGSTFVSFRKLDRRTRWLSEAIVLIFLFFTCSGARRSYYILPILPFCALLVSVYLTREKHDSGMGFQAWLFGLVALAEIVSSAVWPAVQTYSGFTPPMGFRISTFTIGTLAVLPLAIPCLSRMQGTASCGSGATRKTGACVVAAAVLMGGFFCVQQTALDCYRSKQPFARQLKKRMMGLSPHQIAFFNTTDTTVLFYLGLPARVQTIAGAESARKFLNTAEEEKFLISERRYLKQLTAVLPEGSLEKPAVSETLYPWESKKRRKRKLLAWRIRDIGSAGNPKSGPSLSRADPMRRIESDARAGQETPPGRRYTPECLLRNRPPDPSFCPRIWPRSVKRVEMARVGPDHF